MLVRCHWWIVKHNSLDFSMAFKSCCMLGVWFRGFELFYCTWKRKPTLFWLYTYISCCWENVLWQLGLKRAIMIEHYHSTCSHLTWCSNPQLEPCLGMSLESSYAVSVCHVCWEASLVWERLMEVVNLYGWSMESPEDPLKICYAHVWLIIILAKGYKGWMHVTREIIVVVTW